MDDREERIRAKAHALWEEAGRPEGRSDEHWMNAARLIDAEVRRFVEEGEQKAREVLTNHLDELHRLATALLEYETLTGEEAKKAIAGEDIGRQDPKINSPRPLSIGGSSIPKSRPAGGAWGEPAPQGA